MACFYNLKVKVHQVACAFCARLAALAILMTDDCFCCWMGTKCSSWSICSRGSTLRSYLNPLGHTELLSVQQANLMVGRQGRVMA